MTASQVQTAEWLLSRRGDVVHRADCDRRGRAAPWRVQAGRTLEQVLQTISDSPWYRACTRCMSAGDPEADQLELGQEAREQDQAAAAAAAAQAWRVEALAAIRRLAARPEPFTADDVRALGLDEPASAHAWGSVFTQAAHSGVICRVGYAPSRRPSVRRHPVAQWQGAGQ